MDLRRDADQEPSGTHPEQEEHWLRDRSRCDFNSAPGYSNYLRDNEGAQRPQTRDGKGEERRKRRASVQPYPSIGTSTGLTSYMTSFNSYFQQLLCFVLYT